MTQHTTPANPHVEVVVRWGDTALASEIVAAPASLATVLARSQVALETFAGMDVVVEGHEVSIRVQGAAVATGIRGAWARYDVAGTYSVHARATTVEKAARSF